MSTALTASPVEHPVAIRDASALAACERAANNKRFDELEVRMAQLPNQIECKIRHLWYPGLYVREAFLPKGSCWTTKIHATEHCFVISMGRILAWSGIDGETVEELGAPFTGRTMPGTRRMIEVLEDTIFSTFHVTDKTDVAEIERDIIFRHQDHWPFNVDHNGKHIPKQPAISP